MKITTMNHDYDLCNTYLVEFDSFSIVIDPSIPYDNLEDDFKNKLKYVLITHFHYDHVGDLNTYVNHSITF